MFKPFNVHHFYRSHGPVEKKKFRGFTARVEPSSEAGKVALQIAFCSASDPYCRKEGVKAALSKEPKLINARHLSRVLNEARMQCDGFPSDYTHFGYLYKYMV